MLSYVLSTATSYVGYATASSSPPQFPTDLSTTKVKPNPFVKNAASSSKPSRTTSSASSSSSKQPQGPSPYPNPAFVGPTKPPSTAKGKTPASTQEKYGVIHTVLRHENLYDVLGVPRTTSDGNALRRAYMNRCKNCHPDKFPEYPLATLAFQKVSFAYDILSHVPSRRAYDSKGFAATFSSSTSDSNGNYYAHRAPDDTLNAVLYGVFCDFMDGDFEMIRTFIRAMGEINPAMNIGEDTVENLVNTFRRMREILLAGQKYVRIIRFELIRMHEIQSNLRQLSYFDVCGRLRLTLQLARVTLSLPMVVDLAMRDESSTDEDEPGEDSEDQESGSKGQTRGLGDQKDRPRVKMNATKRKAKRGLLHPRVSSLIGLAIGALELGESVL